jgi:hypothetical protein
MNPFNLKEENGGHQVPCGKCYNCKMRRASHWSVRLMNHYEDAGNGIFVTLTYDTRYVPITKKGFMTLEKKHVQNFIKRLRQWQKDEAKSISYYAVGEYGGKTYRPHYHLILFNAKIEYIEKSWSDCIDKKNGKFRKLGEIHYGTLTPASVGYTLKYISKAKRIPLHQNDDRVPEFALMSKGIGLSYLKENMVKWHLEKPNERIYIPLPDGKKASMPRYYKEKIYSKELKEQAAFYWKQKADLEKEKQITQYGDEYQKVKEEQYFNGNRKLNINQSKSKIL